MNFGTQAKAILAAVAPILGGALGGPFGAAAGLALQKAIGISDPKAVEAAITSGDPDILLKLKQADNDFQTQMATLGVEQEKLRYEDVANARGREVAVKDHTPAVLAAAVTIGFFAILAYLIAYGVPKEGGDALLLLLGALGTVWTQIASYYYGSSSGSAQKSTTIAKIAETMGK